jgi:hypothetical protein
VSVPTALSVVIPVVERGENVARLHKAYVEVLAPLIAELEFVYVVSPRYSKQAQQLMQCQKSTCTLTLVQLSREFGEATALLVGVREASHEMVLTLPAYEQVQASALTAIFEASPQADIIDVRRYPRTDGWFNRLRGAAFGRVLQLLTGTQVADAGCVIRLAQREVYANLRIYGDLHRFVSVLALQEGYTVTTVDCPQADADRYRRGYSLTTYLARGLDLITATLLTRYRQKPLRFFGLGGLLFTGIGLVGLGYVAYERLFYAVAAADRPLLLVFSIFMMLGIQLLAIGLVGETVIFTHSQDNKGRQVKEIFRNTGP